MKTGAQKAREAAYSKRKRAATKPHAYRFPRNQVDKKLFAQIRINFDLNALSLTAAKAFLCQLSATHLEPPDLKMLKADASNSYIPWDAGTVLSGLRIFAGLFCRSIESGDWLSVVNEFNNVAFRIRDAAIGTGGPLVRADGGITFGISSGLGQMKPINLKLPSNIHDIVQELNKPNASRVPLIVGNYFPLLAPKMYRTYVDKLQALFERMPQLKRIFLKSPFPTASFEFRNGRPCDIHRGHPNGSAGWCALFAGGEFDPTAGGHLYFPQAELIIEFPPGATVLIPSTIVYGILPVPEGQTRYTFSQFFPADVLRYIDNGFRTRCSASCDNGPEDSEVPSMHWSERDVELFSRLDELHDDRENMGLLTASNAPGA